MHPILFKIGPINVYSYGVMIAIGFTVAICLARQQAEKEGFDGDRIIDLGLYLLIAGIVGARLLYVLTNLSEYLKFPLEIIMLNHGGLVIYGGIILATFTGIFFLSKRKIPILKTADILFPYVALAQSIGRIGCLLNGCCYGRPTSLPWGIYFPGQVIALHPTEIYFSLNALAIFLILKMVQKRKRFTGQVFLLYFILYSATRFGIEFFRGDSARNIFGVFTLSQIISIIIFVVALLIYHRRSLLGRTEQRI